jgi:hypothetical protein
VERLVTVPAEGVGWSLTPEEKACPDCPKTKNRPKEDLQRLLKLSTMSHGSTIRCALPLMNLAMARQGSGPRQSRLSPVVGRPKGEEGCFLLAGERGILGRCLSMPLSDLWIADTLLSPTRKHGL